jgi:hypothetical protein
VTDWGEYTYQLLKWFPDKSKGLRDEKKLLGLCVEKEGTEMIALGPKSYTIKAYEKGQLKDTLKVKGVSLKQNPQITFDSYKTVITKKFEIHGENIMLTMWAPKGQPYVMTKQKQPKIAMTSIHNKMRVLPNQCCAPFILGLERKQYSIL